MPLCNKVKSLQKRAKNIMSKNSNKEVSLFACKKNRRASFTLEAALVIPLVTYFLASILFLFRVIQVETEVYLALNYASRQTAAMSHLAEKQEAELVIAEGFFWSKISKSKTAKNYLTGMQKVFVLAQSKFDGEYINLTADYKLEVPFSIFALRDIHIRQTCQSRKWTGAALSETADGDYVYVTENGTVYHLTMDCNYLDLSIQTVSCAKIAGLRNASGHKYYACERCVAKNPDAQELYVTDYGEAYHSTIRCSGLKRTVNMILMSEISGMKVCSKCKNQTR